MSTLATAPPRSARKVRSQRMAALRVDALILAGIVAVSVAVQHAFASSSFFFQDDWIVFHQSLAGGLFDTLTTPVAAHFAPGHRVLDFIITRYLPHYHDALALLLCFHAASVVLVQRTLALLFGRKWWTFALALAFGLSLIYGATLWWYASAAHTIPAVTFSLACIHSHVAWRQTRRWGWLAWSLAALCIGLLFYIETILVPVYLVLLAVLILRPDEPLVARTRSVAREWRIWALYAVPVLAIAIVWMVGGYSDTHGTKVSLIPEYLRLAWTDGFVPPLFGAGMDPLNPTVFSQWIALLGEIAVLVAFAVSLVRRPTAWKAWVFFAIGFVITALMVTSRLGPFGAIIASWTRYYTETAVLVPIALAAAFARPPRLGAARTRSSSIAALRGPRRAVGIIVAAVLVANAALVAFADHGFVDDRAYATKRWVHNIELGVALARLGDPRPALLDTPVPPEIEAAFTPAERQLSFVSSAFLHDVRFNAVAQRTYAVGPDGTVQPVAFVHSGGGDLGALRRTGEATLTGATWSREGPDSCVTGGPAFGTLQIQPRTALRGREWWVRASYRTPPGAGLLVSVNAGVGYPPWWSPGLPAEPKQSSALLRTEPVPTGVPTLAGVRILVPKQTKLCFRAVEFGWFRDLG